MCVWLGQSIIFTCPHTIYNFHHHHKWSMNENATVHTVQTYFHHKKMNEMRPYFSSGPSSSWFAYRQHHKCVCMCWMNISRETHFLKILSMLSHNSIPPTHTHTHTIHLLKYFHVHFCSLQKIKCLRFETETKIKDHHRK